MKRIVFGSIIPISFLVIGIFIGAAADRNDRLFDISKNLEIFGSVYKELNKLYVDEPKPGELMKTGIDAMLSSLDPYTVYIPEEAVEDYKIQLTGQYSGIGLRARMIDGKIVVAELFEGFPAAKSGVKVGDVLKEVNSTAVAGMTIEQVGKMMKGTAGSSVKIKVERDGQSSGTEFVITRQEVKEKNVSHSTMLANKVGYIRLDNFMKDAANEVRAAAAQLKQDGATSIMLDLRDNPGGLLTEAVNIVGIFVERGQLVTTMRGRVREWDKQFRSEHAPLDTKMPLVVLVNSGSASASEIVSGALQDLDRAVIIGQRSFGKGLVQNTVPLVYGSLFKVTIAKYYIPSGRCVQSLDYSHRNPDGTVKRMNDSLITPFKTRNGRAVWDGLGIIPDMELDHPKYSTLTDTLEQSGVMFKFASQYVKQHATIAPADQFRLTDAEYNDFIQFAKSQKVQYITPEERHLKSFKENASQSGTFASGATEFAALDKKVQDEKSDDYIQYKTEIKALLEQEISGRYYFRTGRLANGFTTDREVQAGITLLSDLARYNSILTTVVDAPKPKQRADLERR